MCTPHSQAIHSEEPIHRVPHSPLPTLPQGAVPRSTAPLRLRPPMQSMVRPLCHCMCVCVCPLRTCVCVPCATCTRAHLLVRGRAHPHKLVVVLHQRVLRLALRGALAAGRGHRAGAALTLHAAQRGVKLSARHSSGAGCAHARPLGSSRAQQWRRLSIQPIARVHTWAYRRSGTHKNARACDACCFWDSTSAAAASCCAAASVNSRPCSSRCTCMTSKYVRNTACSARWRGFTRKGCRAEGRGGRQGKGGRECERGFEVDAGREGGRKLGV